MNKMITRIQIFLLLLVSKLCLAIGHLLVAMHKRVVKIANASHGIARRLVEAEKARPPQ
jgi:hypothetical protein